MRLATLALAVALTGCGDPDPAGPDADPVTAAPIFDDIDATVSITEGMWPGVTDRWAGLRAWFSDSPSYMTETLRTGSCRLQVSDTAYCQGCELGFCVNAVCHPWPEARSAGTITVAGLAVPMTLTWMDSYYAQSVTPPDDLFDPGDAITVTATGGDVAGFTAAVTGVATIAPALAGPCDNEVHVTRGEDLEITWPDPVAGSRVRLRLPSPTNGHGMPPRAIVECEGPDTGQFRVPAALIDGLPDLVETDGCSGVGCVGVDCPPSSLARYTRSVTTAGPEPVVVRVESEVSFYLFDD